MSIFSKKRKIAARYRARWRATIAKYDLKIPSSMYHHISMALGKAEDTGLGKIFKNMFRGGGFLGLLTSIFTIVTSVFTCGATMALNIASAALSLAQSVYSAYAGVQSEKIAAALNGVRSHSAMLKQKGEVYSQGDRITEHIVYTDYQIYATGSIYNKNNPGSQTYSPSLAYDTSKGIFGKIKFSQIDEQTQNRGHFTSAGNKGFIFKTLNVPFKLAEGGLTNEQIQDAIENNVRVNHRRIANGFTILAQQKMNHTGELDKIYNWVIKQQIHPFYHKMINWDFLDKLKNYQRALRADFDYIYMNHFTKKNESTERKKQSALKAIKAMPNFQKYLNNLNENSIKQAFLENIADLGLIRVLRYNALRSVFTEKNSYMPVFLSYPCEEFDYSVFSKITGNKIAHKRAKINSYNALEQVVRDRAVYRYFWNYNHSNAQIVYKYPLKNADAVRKKIRNNPDPSFETYKEFYFSIEVYNLEDLKQDFANFKAAYKQKLSDELAEFEYKAMQKAFYIQRSKIYTLEEKAKDHLETIEVFCNSIACELEPVLYKTQNVSVLSYYDSYSETDKKLILNQVRFKSLSNKTSIFYTLETPLLKVSENEKTIFDFEDNNAMRSFYLALTKDYLGTAWVSLSGTYSTQTHKAFYAGGIFAIFSKADVFEDLKNPVYYDTALNGFDFNKIDLKND